MNFMFEKGDLAVFGLSKLFAIFFKESFELSEAFIIFGFIVLFLFFLRVFELLPLLKLCFVFILLSSSFFFFSSSFLLFSNSKFNILFISFIFCISLLESFETVFSIKIILLLSLLLLLFSSFSSVSFTSDILSFSPFIKLFILLLLILILLSSLSANLNLLFLISFSFPFSSSLLSILLIKFEIGLLSIIFP